MALTLTAVQRVSVEVSAVDAKGNPAEVEEVIFSSSDEAILIVEQDSTDMTKAWATAVGPTGTAQVKVTADADIGEGTKNLTGLLDVEVVAAEAASLGLTAGTPEEAPVVNPLEGESPS
jgi:hypothetical protein